jgi:hypothetical protein
MEQPPILNNYNRMIRALQLAPSNKRLVSHIKWRLFRNKAKQIVTDGAERIAMATIRAAVPKFIMAEAIAKFLNKK